MLTLKLNPSLGVPIYRQIMDEIREMIASNTLKPGDKLPSIRELASHLRINPSSAVKAYNELKHAGIIELDQGRGTFVSHQPDLAVETQQELLRKDVAALLERARLRGVAGDEVLAELENQIHALKGDQE